MPRAYLKRFRLRGFRSCKDASFELADDVSVLIGRNGSGKTNLLQGLTLLKGTVRRAYQEDELDTSASRCEVEADFKIGKKTAFYRGSITFRTNDRRRQDDVIGVREKWNFREFGWKKEWETSPFLSLFYGRDRRQIYWSGVAVRHFSRAFQRKIPKLPKQVIDALDSMRTLCSRISYYSASQFTNPALCPTSFEIDEDGDLLTGPRTGVHSRFLFDLYDLEQKNREQYLSFISLVGKRGLGLIDRIAFKSVKFLSHNYEVRSGGRLVNKRSERKLIVPTVHVGTSRLSFNQLSEGTFRTLALLFYVITDKSTLLLLEEPEVCVHHGLLNSVIDIIKDFSTSKQIVFSTHSEAVVDRVSPEQIRLVENYVKRGTIVRPLSNALSQKGYAALKEYLVNTGPLGEYWKTAGFSE